MERNNESNRVNRVQKQFDSLFKLKIYKSKITQVSIKTHALTSRVPHHYLKAKNSLNLLIMTVSHSKWTRVLQLWNFPVVWTCFRWHYHFNFKNREISNYHKTHPLIIKLKEFQLMNSWDLNLLAQLRNKLRRILRLKRIQIGIC